MIKKTKRQLVAFCKSYIGDLKRVKNLITSFIKYNNSNIDFYLSVPEKDINHFADLIKNNKFAINLVLDEDIIKLCSNEIGMLNYKKWDGRLSQQVLKILFAKYIKKKKIYVDNYLILDSECIFTKKFGLSDFLYNDEVPFTVMYENIDHVKNLPNFKKRKILHELEKEAFFFKKIYNRQGPNYQFSPVPVVWSCKVIEDLYEKFLSNKNIDIWDFIASYSSELYVYGETLLHFESIPIKPVKPFFKVYHYDIQYEIEKKSLNKNNIDNFFGFLKQSSWDFENDFGEQITRKSYLSKKYKKLKRFLYKFL